MPSIQLLVLAAAISGGGETVLLDFTSDRCIYCEQMEPTIRQLESAGYPVRRINGSQSPEWARQFNVSGFPTYVMLSGGQEVGRVVGKTSRDQLIRLFEAAHLRPGASREQYRGQSPDSPAPPPARPAPVSQFSEPYSPPSAPLEMAAPRDVAPRTTNLTPEQRAQNATVRLTIKYAGPGGNTILDHGSGTIIDAQDGEALVLTCGHVFRDSDGRGEITVELNGPSGPASVAGELIAFHADERDIALVGIRPPTAVTPAQVAAGGYASRPGGRVFSVGYDHGRDLTLRRGRIMEIVNIGSQRNVTVSGSPVDGRSGGGLFNSDGFLIGVCKANYVREDKGLYAGIDTVHWQLTQINQQRIFERADQPAIAGASEIANRHNDFAFQPPREIAPPSDPQAQRASASVNPVSYSDEFEAILFLRSRSDPSQYETLTLDRLPPSLLDRLKREFSAQQTGDHLARDIGDAAMRSRPPIQPPARGPVIRAQSEE